MSNVSASGGGMEVSTSWVGEDPEILLVVVEKGDLSRTLVLPATLPPALSSSPEETAALASVLTAHRYPFGPLTIVGVAFELLGPAHYLSVVGGGLSVDDLREVIEAVVLAHVGRDTAAAASMHLRTVTG